MVSHCSFNLYFPNDYYVYNFFMRHSCYFRNTGTVKEVGVEGRLHEDECLHWMCIEMRETDFKDISE